MFERLLNMLGGDFNKKQIKRLSEQMTKITAISEEWDSLTDADIKAKTQEFKDRIAAGATLDSILPEAFATVKQACKRLVGTKYTVKGEDAVRNMVPYDVQIVGGLALNEGMIAEMKTGEGKTLVASMPAYANALMGKGVHVVTVNDYLTSRDAEQMGLLYEWLGLTVGHVTKQSPLSNRRNQYACDITYIENTELGFDYLRDNLATSFQNRNMLRRPLAYAIVDEADSILIDEARTPLIISQPSGIRVDKYEAYAKIARSLIPSTGKKKISKGFLKELIDDAKKEPDVAPDGDYFIDEKTKTASLSSAGIAKLEKMFGVENLYRDLGHHEIHYIENALKADAVYHKDKDYLVRDGEVLIVDEHTGRTMPGRRYSEGLHQAIEAKEGVAVQEESTTIATITYQNFFKQYPKLSGMTGTALTESEEFSKIYELDTIVIPTNRDTIRVDKTDRVYFNQESKRNNVIKSIRFAHEMGQPILIGTSSINTSEQVSYLLGKANIPHNVLNAKQHEKEAFVVANAGKMGSVMVATNMAGRGTDIKLDAGLSQKIAKNYAKRIAKQLANNTGVMALIYSSDEYETTMDALQTEFGFSSDLVRQAEKASVQISDTAEMRCVLNPSKYKSKDSKNELLVEIQIKPLGQTVPFVQQALHYGLYILGTEKHDSRRIDNQLRGRSGRQGDAGVSQFFVALDDEIMRKMGGERIQGIAKMLLSADDLKDLELTQKQFTSSIESSQVQMEGRLFGIRKHLFEYDSVVDKQRQRMYAKRDQLLQPATDDSDEQDRKLIDEVMGFVPEVVEKTFAQYEVLEVSKDEILTMITNEFAVMGLDASQSMSQLKQQVMEHLLTHINAMAVDGSRPNLANYIRTYYLRSIDKNRIEHIDVMQGLREKVGFAGYAQMDPLVLYKQEAFESFAQLLLTVKKEVLTAVSQANPLALQAGQVVISTVPNQESELLAMVEGIASQMLADGKTTPKSAQQKANQVVKDQQTKSQIFNKSDDSEFEIFENGVEAPAVHDTSTKKKVRPNDKVTVQYTDGKIKVDKYKKLEEDVTSGKARIVG